MPREYSLKTTLGLLVASGLILVGAGCGEIVSQDSDSTVDSSKNAFAEVADKLALEGIYDQYSIKGLDKICDFGNAQLLYGKYLDFSAINDKINQQQAAGWDLKKFCVTPNATPTVTMAFTKTQADTQRGTEDTWLQAVWYDGQTFVISETANAGVSVVSLDSVADIEIPNLPMADKNVTFTIYINNADMEGEWYTLYSYDRQDNSLKYLKKLDK